MMVTIESSISGTVSTEGSSVQCEQKNKSSDLSYIIKNAASPCNL